MAVFEHPQLIAANMAADPYRVVRVIETHADAMTVQHIECDLTPVLTGGQVRTAYEELRKIAILVGDVTITEIANEELELMGLGERDDMDDMDGMDKGGERGGVDAVELEYMPEPVR